MLHLVVLLGLVALSSSTVCDPATFSPTITAINREYMRCFNSFFVWNEGVPMYLRQGAMLNCNFILQRDCKGNQICTYNGVDAAGNLIMDYTKIVPYPIAVCLPTTCTFNLTRGTNLTCKGGGTPP